jgi:hypothetical protein
MKSSPPANGKPRQLLLDAARKRFMTEYARGRYAAALTQCLQAARLAPAIAQLWSDASVCCVKLERWDDAILYGQRALQLKGQDMATFDALAQAWGHKEHWQEVRDYGLQALHLRQTRFAGGACQALAPVPCPPPPCPASREHNIIAFSLFGARAKYCECAVLNALERARVYPDWSARFYIDDRVPLSVTRRLEHAGCEVQSVSPERQKSWPGPMWRFMAYDTPGVQRVIFRDADAIIGTREASAVDEWVRSGRRFHMMRDSASHTELILAGLWGVVAGALPAMETLVEAFLRTPLQDAHFADQFFLRQFVWPYAQASLLQHDGIFGFLDPLPFPQGAPRVSLHQQVGSNQAAPTFQAAVDLPDGTPVIWQLLRIEQGPGGRREVPLCDYAGVVENRQVADNLPRRYVEMLQNGEMLLRINPA